MVDDTGAVQAYQAYLQCVLRYSDPSKSPDFPKVMQDLNEAADYLATLPLDMITEDHEKLAARIDAILLRD